MNTSEITPDQLSQRIEQKRAQQAAELEATALAELEAERTAAEAQAERERKEAERLAQIEQWRADSLAKLDLAREIEPQLQAQLNRLIEALRHVQTLAASYADARWQAADLARRAGGLADVTPLHVRGLAEQHGLKGIVLEGDDMPTRYISQLVSRWL